MPQPKIVIVGGVAAGASAAAKARRVSEQAEIVLFERGPYISFANCGLPYYIGEEIHSRDALLLQTPESFWKRFRVKVQVLHEVLGVDRAAKTVSVKNLSSGETFVESYDQLILAPGAGANVPPLPGVDQPNVFTIKTVPESERVRQFIAENHPRRAVVVGAGFIGLEAAEALRMRGLQVTVVEMQPQVLPPFDADMARFVAESLEHHGIELVLADGLKAFHGEWLAKEVELQSGRRLPMDLAILSIGVRPELKLAKEAGLAIGESGGISVDEHQRTSDPSIFAAGDAVELLHQVTGKKTRMPLAGPANKQGRVAGANAAGEALAFPGALGTAIVESMGVTAAKTGLSEKEAAAAGIDSFISYTHSADHATYYPGSSMLHMKLVAERSSGRLLGAQVVGERGVDKRIDVLATALSAGFKVTDLENLDLAYAPQFSSAKDPVVMAGFVASNVLRDEVETIDYAHLKARLEKGEALQLVDVRSTAEYHEGHLNGAMLIPVDQLRERIGELDPEKETIVYCRIGLRGYLAARILRQSRFKRVLNLTGGMLSCPPERKIAPAQNGNGNGQATASGGVSVAQLKAALEKKSAYVIDVREEDEFQYEHIAQTRNVPLARLGKSASSLPSGQPVLVLCQSGFRTEQAVKLLHASGHPEARAVTGGIQAWKLAGYPIERKKGPIPIMRQVQIVAGSLALIGGLFVSARWVAAFVGAGLIFAGVSGTCAMATLLAKMPWNKTDLKADPPGKSGCGGC